MKTLLYCKSGIAVSDWDISQFIDDILNANLSFFKVSTNLVIDEIRARIKEGKLDRNNFQLIVEDSIGLQVAIDIDKNGTLSDYIEEQQVASNILLRLL